MEFTWKFVKDGNPKRKGIYIVATKGNKKAIVCEFERGKWYLYGFETENGGKLEMSPYAWTEFPDRPKE